MRDIRRGFLTSILLLALPVSVAATVAGPAKQAKVSGPVYTREHSQPAAQANSAVSSRRRFMQPRRKGILLPSNAGFLTASETVLPGSATTFAVGDFDGDGHQDIATVIDTGNGQPQLGVLLGNGDGTFKSAVSVNVNFNASSDSLLAGDLNQDGKDDVVLVHGGTSGSVDVLLSVGAGAFASAVNYPDTITTVTGMAILDANGDNHPDILLANGIGGIDTGATPQVSMFLNNGDGTFAAATSVPVPASFSYAVFADVNGDGKPDLVTDTQVFLATTGGYQAGIALPGAVATSATDGSVAVAKLNADSQPDIVVVNSGAQTLTVYLNAGGGNFTQGATYWAGFAPQWVAVADVNGDHVNDLVVGDATSADLMVLSGNGDGTFNTTETGFAAGGALSVKPILADFNGDGKTDAVVLQSTPAYATAVTFLRGYGDGTFLAANNYYSPTNNDNQPEYGVGVVSADLNGDQVPDFILGNSGGPSSGITVFVANSDGTLKPGVNYGSGGYLEFVAAADFNRDGKQDIVASDLAAGDAYLFLGNGDGTLQPAQPIAVSNGQGQGGGIVVGDFNNDGWPDMAMVAAPSSLYVLLNNQAGGFNPPTAYPLSSPGWQITAADVNGDGKVDLLVTLGSNYVAVLTGKGDGTFTALADVDLGAFYPDTVAVGDFNKDGAMDLAVSVDDSSGAMGIATLLGNGNGTFQPAVLLASSTSSSAGSSSYPGQIRAVDLNRDGQLDLVYTNSGFGTVGVMYGNGDGTFLSPLEFPVGGWPYSVAMTDLNADGATDAVIGNDNYSGVTALLNYGGAKVSLSSSVNPATTANSILFTANVSGVHGVAVVPTGTITFKDGATVLNSVSLSNGTASLNVSNLTAGAHVISAIYSGNSAFLSGSASMVETITQAATGTYTLAANPTSANIHPGQSASFMVTATPVNGFTGSISFDCGTLPTGMSCQFTPSTITISGSQAASTQLVVTASKNVLNSGIPNGGPFGTMPLWASFTGILFGAVTMDGSEQKKRRAVLITLLIVGLLAGMVMLTGCATAGGNGSHQNAVAKTVQVKARAANGTTQSLTVTVYVQQN